MAAYHPQLVHFTIALLVLGVVLRVVSLGRRPAFVAPAATLLILLGTVAAVLAAKSGIDAHGPVERIPGARAAVVEHEEWGLRTRNIFLGVAALELAGLALWRSRRRVWVHAAAALIGVTGLWTLYEAGEHGGELVYSYAGGVGIRSGDPDDVGRLLLAGLYHQAQQDRQRGRAADAAALVEHAVRRFPDDAEVQLLAAESLLLDRHDGTAAVAALERIRVPPANRVLQLRLGMLKADALDAAGRSDEATATLKALAAAFPASPRVRERLGQLEAKRGGTAPAR
jgi:uncharacterized membrane protein